MLYFATSSFDKSQVLSEVILMVMPENPLFRVYEYG